MRKQCSLFARFCRVAKRAKMVNIWETRLRSFVSFFLGGGGGITSIFLRLVPVVCYPELDASHLFSGDLHQLMFTQPIYFNAEI